VVILQWLEHFSSFGKPNQEDTVLIVEEHSSHKYVNVLSLKNKVVFLCCV
jgi:hypothetical protein